VPIAPPPRHNRVLELIALFKLVKAALLTAVGLGALRLVHEDIALLADRWMAALTSNVWRHLLVEVAERASALSPAGLHLLGIGAFLYAGLFVTEGVGLWLEQRWAEYLTAIATATLIPLEVRELWLRLTVPRVSALVINLAVVAYLVRQLRRT
jgi:uncharacterized membrane protein (DUF2068 family)